MKLSVDFAFAGIKIITKNPVAVLLWGLAAMVFGLVATVLMVVLAGPAMMALQAQSETPATDPAEVMAQFGALTPGWLAAMIIGLISGAIIQCAIFRSQLRPGEGGFGFMKFGGDEIRQIIVTILYFLAVMVFYILFFLVVMLLAVLTRFAGQGSGIVGAILMFVVMIGGTAAFLYVLSRWSLVLVQSYAERKINVFGSLKLTKGNGWTLFGGYFLLVVAVIIAMIVIYGILFAATMGASLGNGADLATAFQEMSQPDMSSLAGLFTLNFILQTLVGGLISGAFYALFHGATVSAYQALTQDASKADLF